MAEPVKPEWLPNEQLKLDTRTVTNQPEVDALAQKNSVRIAAVYEDNTLTEEERGTEVNKLLEETYKVQKFTTVPDGNIVIVPTVGNGWCLYNSILRAFGKEQTPSAAQCLAKAMVNKLKERYTDNAELSRHIVASAMSERVEDKNGVNVVDSTKMGNPIYHPTDADVNGNRKVIGYEPYYFKGAKTQLVDNSRSQGDSFIRSGSTIYRAIREDNIVEYLESLYTPIDGDMSKGPIVWPDIGLFADVIRDIAGPFLVYESSRDQPFQYSGFSRPGDVTDPHIVFHATGVHFELITIRGLVGNYTLPKNDNIEKILKGCRSNGAPPTTDEDDTRKILLLNSTFQKILDEFIAGKATIDQLEQKLTVVKLRRKFPTPVNALLYVSLPGGDPTGNDNTNIIAEINSFSEKYKGSGCNISEDDLKRLQVLQFVVEVRGLSGSGAITKLISEKGVQVCPVTQQAPSTKELADRATALLGQLQVANAKSENQPSSTANQPSSTANQPSSTENQPSTAENQPSSTENQPSTTTIQPSTTANQPSSTANQPSSTANQPSSTANQPSSTENQPSSTENQPSTAENQPSSTENQPSSTENQPSSTGSQELSQPISQPSEIQGPPPEPTESLLRRAGITVKAGFLKTKEGIAWTLSKISAMLKSAPAESRILLLQAQNQVLTDRIADLTKRVTNVEGLQKQIDDLRKYTKSLEHPTVTIPPAIVTAADFSPKIKEKLYGKYNSVSAIPIHTPTLTIPEGPTDVSSATIDPKAVPEWAAALFTYNGTQACKGSSFMPDGCENETVFQHLKAADSIKSSSRFEESAPMKRLQELQEKLRNELDKGKRAALEKEIKENYPDNTIQIVTKQGQPPQLLRVPNPYRAHGYRKNRLPDTRTFGAPAGPDDTDTASMRSMNIAIKDTGIFPEQVLTDKAMTVSLLRSLWSCGQGGAATSPDCFPLQVLGELYENKAFEEQRASKGYAQKILGMPVWSVMDLIMESLKDALPVSIAPTPSTTDATTTTSPTTDATTTTSPTTDATTTTVPTTVPTIPVPIITVPIAAYKPLLPEKIGGGINMRHYILPSTFGRGLTPLLPV